nr:uncharacterized protein LOC117987551 [Maniola hyperantus]
MEEEAENIEMTRRACTLRGSVARQVAVNFMPSRQVAHNTLRLRRATSEHSALLDAACDAPDAADMIVREMEQHRLLMEDNPLAEELRREALRDLPRGLTMKRTVRAKLSASVSLRSKRRPISRLKRLKYRISFAWKRVSDLRDLVFSVELWYEAIRNIEGHLGSAVGSYFRLLRWLFALNLLLSAALLAFVVVPQALHAAPGDASAGARPSVLDFISGKGGLEHSLLFFGSYHDAEIARHYMPGAYFYTMLCLHLMCFVGGLEHSLLFFGSYHDAEIARHYMPGAYFYTMLCLHLMCFVGGLEHSLLFFGSYHDAEIARHYMPGAYFYTMLCLHLMCFVGGLEHSLLFFGSYHDAEIARHYMPGRGGLEHSLLFFGSYHDAEIAAPGARYYMPFAYFYTMLCLYLMCFVVLCYRTAASYRRNFIEPAGGLAAPLAAKLFCGWDFGIASPRGAARAAHALFLEFKELLNEQNKQKLATSLWERAWRRATNALVTALVLAATAGVQFALWRLLAAGHSEVSISLAVAAAAGASPVLLSFIVKFWKPFSTKVIFLLPHLCRYTDRQVGPTDKSVRQTSRSDRQVGPAGPGRSDGAGYSGCGQERWCGLLGVRAGAMVRATRGAGRSDGAGYSGCGQERWCGLLGVRAGAMVRATRGAGRSDGAGYSGCGQERWCGLLGVRAGAMVRATRGAGRSDGAGYSGCGQEHLGRRALTARSVQVGVLLGAHGLLRDAGAHVAAAHRHAAHAAAALGALRGRGERLPHCNVEHFYVTWLLHIGTLLMLLVYWARSADERLPHCNVEHFYVTWLLHIGTLLMLLVYWARSADECWETRVGQEGYRLVLLDALLSLLLLPAAEVARGMLFKCNVLRSAPAFDIAYSSLTLIYNQAVLWLAVLFAPLLAPAVTLKLLLLFYVKRETALRTCHVGKKVWRAAQTQTVLYMLVTLSLFATLFALGSLFLRSSSRTCGPFRQYEHVFAIVSEGLLQLSRHDTLRAVLHFVVRPGPIAFVLLALCVCVYIVRARGAAQRCTARLLRQMRRLQAKDKDFLLAAIEKVSNGEWLYRRKAEAREAQAEAEDSHTWRYLREVRRPSNAAFHFDASRLAHAADRPKSLAQERPSSRRPPDDGDTDSSFSWQGSASVLDREDDVEGKS